MKRFTFVALLLVTLLVGALPNSLAQPKVHEFTLENGLKVLLVPRPGTGITAVDLWVNVGSLNETREISGISHFFEHMLFKGTERRPRGIDREVEALGGRTNAATSYDFTHYYIILPSEHTKLAIDIIADITQNSTFPEEEITREKEVVLREQQQRSDNPTSFAFFTLRQEFYTVHPYKLPIIGFADSLERLTREDFLNWMRTYYVPNNMTLVVVGDIEIEQTLQIVKEKFGTMERKSIPTQTYPKEPARTEKTVQEIRRDVSQGYLIFAWPGPSIREAQDVYAMDVLITLLSDGRGSRFYKKLRKELGLVTAIDAGYFTQKEPGIFSIYAEFPYENRVAVEQAILQELKEILDGKLSADEVERAKTVLLAQEALQAETAAGFAGTLGFYSVVAGDYKFALTYPEKIRAITVQDIVEVARKYINLDTYYELVLIPETAEQPTTDELVVLPNGLKLILREDHSAETVALQAFVGTGARAEPSELTGIAELTSRLLLRGTTTRSEEELFTEIENLGAQLSQDVLPDMAHVMLVTPKETLKRALPIYLDVLLNPAFAPDEVERVKTEFIREIRAQADQNFSVIYNNFQSALYGAHPYGRIPTVESVARITREDIVQFYKKYYVPNNMTIVAVGAFDRTLLEALLRAKLQELPQGAEELPLKPQPISLALTENKRVEATKRLNLTWLIVGYPAPPVSSPDYPAMKLLNAILGSGMSSRLFSELRDKRGLAYSTGSFYPSRAEDSHLVTYIIALPQNAETAQQGILEIIKDIQENGVPQDELDRAKSYVIGNYRIDHETTERRAWYLGWYETLGVGYQMDARYPELIQAVTSEDIRRVAQKYLQYYVLSVLGPSPQ
ncbi:MAG: insulinase family protein [Candidatus Bipolaricaulota bacterium]|nr:insulinase family protein [Candidatus Bipolaricaulota bacterium]MDW8030311.1 pitrilysin family protein [Candidatus Bipolaricaulota bacterium]